MTVSEHSFSAWLGSEEMSLVSWKGGMAFGGIAASGRKGQGPADGLWWFLSCSCFWHSDKFLGHIDEAESEAAQNPGPCFQ